MQKHRWLWLGSLIIGLYVFSTFAKCGGDAGTVETLFPYDRDAVDSVADLYDVALEEGTIADLFGVEPDQPIGPAEMEAFLRDQVGIIPMDAKLAASVFGRFRSVSFIPDSEKHAALLSEGLSQAAAPDGLTPKQFLTYLRVVHGEGRCEHAAGGTEECPAKVRDFQLHLIVLQNPIFNIRSVSTQDEQYENKFSIHRESYANRMTFDFIGMALGLGGDPLRKVVLDDQCELLISFLATGENLGEFMVDEMGVAPEVAKVVVNQYTGTEEIYDGEVYQYGLEAFLRGDVCSRYPDRQGKCYEQDMALYDRILEIHPGFAPGNDLSCVEIKDMVNVLMSYPPSISDPQDLFSPPFDEESPDLTADELVDIVLAIANALTNKPNAPFADIIPQRDLELLNACGVENCENQVTSKSINYFGARFLEDRPL